MIKPILCFLDIFSEASAFTSKKEKHTTKHRYQNFKSKSYCPGSRHLSATML